ncbi:hypothetical protein [Spirosoma linguale]|uniref:hypothetical protein n=1 Tax=Spirosoma linguale TaxID=108 RepID=UPI0001A3C1C0
MVLPLVLNDSPLVVVPESGAVPDSAFQIPLARAGEQPRRVGIRGRKGPARIETQ